jgi:hypothetical protein
MSTKPRNPYLLPGLVAAVVIGAGLGASMLVVIDDSGSAAAGRLNPEVVQRIEDLRAEREWAASVCGALDTWRNEIGDATESVFDGFDITDPQSTWDLANTAFGDARDATATMVEEVRAVKTPDTPAGRALAEGIEDLLDHATAHIEEIGIRVSVVGTDIGVGDGFNLPGLIDETQAFIDDARRDIEALRAPAKEMLTVLRANDDCTSILTAVNLD